MRKDGRWARGNGGTRRTGDFGPGGRARPRVGAERVADPSGPPAARGEAGGGAGHGDREDWRGPFAMTLGLSALLAAAFVPDGGLLAGVVMLTGGAGLGLLHWLFPRGLHFAFGTAVGYAVYTCLYVYLAEISFPDARFWAKATGFLLPIAAFLAAVRWRRAELTEAAEARSPLDVAHLPRIARWLLLVAAVGVVAAAMPVGRMDRTAQGVALLAAMATVAGVVAASVRDVVRIMVDVALILGTVGRHVGRLAVPIAAYLSIYALLAIVFACFYRIADSLSRVALFSTSQGPVRMDFVDALHFSVTTLSTVGYGDFQPHDPGVRVLASAQAVSGQLLLLFGFAEIMRGSREWTPAGQPETDDTNSPPDPGPGTAGAGGGEERGREGAGAGPARPA